MWGWNSNGVYDRKKRAEIGSRDDEEPEYPEQILTDEPSDFRFITDSDLEKYIENRIDRTHYLNAVLKHGPALREEVVKHILQNASGMYEVISYFGI